MGRKILKKYSLEQVHAACPSALKAVPDMDIFTFKKVKDEWCLLAGHRILYPKTMWERRRVYWKMDRENICCCWVNYDDYRKAKEWQWQKFLKDSWLHGDSRDTWQAFVCYLFLRKGYIKVYTHRSDYDVFEVLEKFFQHLIKKETSKAQPATQRISNEPAVVPSAIPRSSSSVAAIASNRGSQTQNQSASLQSARHSSNRNTAGQSIVIKGTSNKRIANQTNFIQSKGPPEVQSLTARIQTIYTMPEKTNTDLPQKLNTHKTSINDLEETVIGQKRRYEKLEKNHAYSDKENKKQKLMALDLQKKDEKISELEKDANEKAATIQRLEVESKSKDEVIKKLQSETKAKARQVMELLNKVEAVKKIFGGFAAIDSI